MSWSIRGKRRRDRDLPHRLREFAVAHHEAHGARPRSRRSPHWCPSAARSPTARRAPRAPTPGSPRAECARQEVQGAGPDPRGRLEPTADGRSRRGRTGAARGVDVVEERVESATGDQLEPPGGHALGVVGGRTEGDGEGGVVDKRDRGRRDLFALAAHEQRPALQRSPHPTARRPTARAPNGSRAGRARPAAGPTRICCAPRSRTARSAASRAASSRSRSANARPGREAVPVWVSVPSPRQGEGRARRDRPARARPRHPASSRPRLSTAASPYAADSTPRITRVGALRRGFELERERNLLGGLASRAGRRARGRAPAASTRGEVGGRREPVAARRASRSAALSRASASGLGDDVGVERPGPCVSLTAVDDRPARRSLRSRQPRATRPHRRTP